MSALLQAGASPAGTDLECHVEPLSGGALVADYHAGHSRIQPFYTGHPGDIAAYRRRAAEVDERLGAADRQRMAEAIVPLGDAAPRLERILAGDGYFVTTGQQPALFGGPLYTLYKTLAAIRTAAVLESRLGRPVLALFWIGADDHDWEEANHVSVLDAAGLVERISVDAPRDAPRLPLSARTWGRGIVTAVERMTALLPQTPAGRGIARHLADAYTPDATVEASFTSTMRLLLEGRRIAIVSSAHPALRRAAAPVLRHEVTHAGEHYRVLARQTERLASAGYPVQVDLAEDASNLMQVDEHGRDRLLFTQRGWIARRERHPVTEETLLARLTSDPEAFSPNVLLRPVVESAVFPTIAYVAGPGELRYFAQIGCLFRAHGILPPVVVPRPSVTLVEPAVRRVLERLRLEYRDMRRPVGELLTEIARAEVPAAADEALQRIRGSLQAGYEELVDACAAIDPSLRGPLLRARNESLLQAREAERRILRALRRRDQVRNAQVARAAASLFPNGAPQERVLNPLQYVAQYGPDVVARLEARLDPVAAAPATWEGPACE